MPSKRTHLSERFLLHCYLPSNIFPSFRPNGVPGAREAHCSATLNRFLALLNKKGPPLDFATCVNIKTIKDISWKILTLLKAWQTLFFYFTKHHVEITKEACWCPYILFYAAGHYHSYGSLKVNTLKTFMYNSGQFINSF